MSSKPRIEFQSRSAHRFGLASLSALLAIVSAGCSADVARFDFPAFGLTEKPTAPKPSSPTGSLADEGRRDGPSEDTYRPPMRSGASPREGIGVTNLPDVPPPAARPEPIRERPREIAAVKPGLGTETPPSAAPATTVEVKPGDTIFGLSRRHSVSIQAILDANNLKSATIKPGQKLVIPAPGSAPAPRPKAVVEAPRPAPSATPPAPAEGKPGTYTVKPGDSPFIIARRHGLKVGELLALNDIKDPTKVRPGTVLKVSRGASPAPPPSPEQPAPPLSTATPRATPPAAKPKAEPVTKAEAPAAPPASGTKPRIIGHADPAPIKPEAPTRIASADPKAPLPGSPQEKPKTDEEKAEAPPPPAKEAKVATPEKGAGTPKLSSAGRFRWPVKGKVIAKFGPRSDGGHNDGINIAVPQGTDVMAAENGTVVYAGNELKGYGNLVLVRHENNYVTAYAHNDQILVRRNDKIRRGQVLAKAGKSGAVDQPQVHFEIRQGSKPVDPLPYLDPGQ